MHLPTRRRQVRKGYNCSSPEAGKEQPLAVFGGMRKEASLASSRTENCWPCLKAGEDIPSLELSHPAAAGHQITNSIPSFGYC